MVAVASFWEILAVSSMIKTSAPVTLLVPVAFKSPAISSNSETVNVPLTVAVPSMRWLVVVVASSVTVPDILRLYKFLFTAPIKAFVVPLITRVDRSSLNVVTSAWSQFPPTVHVASPMSAWVLFMVTSPVTFMASS